MNNSLSNTMVVLWGVSASPYVRKVMVALNEKNIPFEQREIFPTSLLKAMHQNVPAEFVKISPLGKIPVLKVLTITGDNGSEFAYHEKIADKLKADFYFAHPYSSWERGLNENTNGLVRQYLKKGSDFASITDADLMVIADKLNNRPRKTLDFSTPNEIFIRMAHGQI